MFSASDFDLSFLLYALLDFYITISGCGTTEDAIGIFFSSLSSSSRPCLKAMPFLSKSRHFLVSSPVNLFENDDGKPWRRNKRVRVKSGKPSKLKAKHQMPRARPLQELSYGQPSRNAGDVRQRHSYQLSNNLVGCMGTVDEKSWAEVITVCSIEGTYQ